jgi:hypothetical protein
MNDAVEPITLSPQEFQEIMNELAGRDPIVRFLMNKQAAAKAGREAGEPPMRVVGGTGDGR